MSGLTDKMVRAFVRRPERVADQAVRHAYVRLECWTSIAGNVVLGALKLALGLMTGSIALVADAAHTFGDMVSSIVLLVSMRVAAAPPDERHPYGHGRAESLGTLALAAMLIVTAVEFFHHSYDRIRAPDPRLMASVAGLGWLVIPLLIAFWAFKEWMARFSEDLGRRISSEALLGDAQHHRSDALATLLVVGSFVGAYLKMPWLDGVLGLGVAAFIGWAGIHLAWQMMSRLLGEAPSPELVSQIMAAAASVRGVHGVHGVVVHDYGHYKVASLHIEVADRMGTAESHALATHVENALSRRLGLSGVVHVEGLNPAPRVAAVGDVEALLRAFMQAEPAVTSFHAVHVLASERERSVDLHLLVRDGLPVEECHRLEHSLADTIRGQFGAAAVNVHCEPASRGRGGAAAETRA